MPLSSQHVGFFFKGMLNVVTNLIFYKEHYNFLHIINKPVPLFFFSWNRVTLCLQAGVQWCDRGSLQSLPPGGSSDSPASAS